MTHTTLKNGALKPLPPGEIRCPYCLRPAGFWPLERGFRCSPDNWVNCIRWFDQIIDEMTDKQRLRIMRALGVKWPRNRVIPTYPSKMLAWQKIEADLLYDQMSRFALVTLGPNAL